MKKNQHICLFTDTSETLAPKRGDILTNNQGGNLSGVLKAGPVSTINGQSFFYNSSASSTRQPSIYMSINRVQVIKFRFPF